MQTTTIALEEIAQVMGISVEDAGHLAGDPTSRRLSPSGARACLERKGFRFPKRNIVFHCLKGGASKTTLAYNSAYRLSQLGARVLLVDLDKQSNATQSLTVDPGPWCFVDLVTGKVKAEQAIVPVAPHLDLLPSNLNNARLEMELMQVRRNPDGYYAGLLSGVRDRYDFVLFDLPPDLNQNTYLSTLFADWVVIPVNADAYSLSGMRMTLDSIESVRKEYGRDLEVLVVWSKFDAREKSGLEYAQELEDLTGARLLPTVVRTDVSFKLAQARGKSIYQMRRKSNAKQDTDALVRELSDLADSFPTLSGEV